MFSHLINTLLCLLISLTIWGPYISSWLIGRFPFTAGAIFRDIVSIILFIIAAFQIFSFKKRTKFDIALIVIYLSTLVYAFICLFLSDSIPIAATGARPYILYSTIYLFAYFNINGKIFSSKVILQVFIINLVITSVIAVIDVLSLGQFAPLLGYNPLFAGENTFVIFSYLGFVRATGGFSDALNFGYYLALGLITCLHLYKTGTNKRVYLTIVVLLFLTIALTITRGAILVAIIAILINFINIKKLLNTAVSLFLFAVIFTVLILFSGYSELLLGRFTGSEQSSNQSSAARITMAVNSIQYLAENPLGVGLGTQGIGAKYSDVDRRINTDNSFFWVALEIGVFGFLLYFTFTGLFLIGLFKKGMDIRIFISLLVLYILSALTSSAPMSPILGLPFGLISCQLITSSFVSGSFRNEKNECTL